MATYSRREVTTTRIEFHIPTHAPWGACWVEVNKAIGAAIAEMRSEETLGSAEVPADDRIRIHCADEALVVAYEREQKVVVPTTAPLFGPRRWPIDSPQPVVNAGFRVRSEVNNVVFRKASGNDWVAEPPMGDGLRYRWFELNSSGAAEGGAPLIEVLDAPPEQLEEG